MNIIRLADDDRARLDSHFPSGQAMSFAVPGGSEDPPLREPPGDEDPQREPPRVPEEPPQREPPGADKDPRREPPGESDGLDEGSSPSPNARGLAGESTSDTLCPHAT